MLHLGQAGTVGDLLDPAHHRVLELVHDEELLRQGVGDIIAYDRKGALHRGMPDLNESMQWLAEHTNKQNYSGDLPGAIVGAAAARTVPRRSLVLRLLSSRSGSTRSDLSG